jgi:hypothetical protein
MAVNIVLARAHSDGGETVRFHQKLTVTVSQRVGNLALCRNLEPLNAHLAAQVRQAGIKRPATNPGPVPYRHTSRTTWTLNLGKPQWVKWQTSNPRLLAMS